MIGRQAAAVLLVCEQHIAARVLRCAQRKRGAIRAVLALQQRRAVSSQQSMHPLIRPVHTDAQSHTHRFCHCCWNITLHVQATQRDLCAQQKVSHAACR